MLRSDDESRYQAVPRRTLARRVVSRVDSRAGLRLTDRLQSMERRLRPWRSSAVPDGGGDSLGRRVRKVESKQLELDGEIRVLTSAIAEVRGLGGRISELTDLVTELLIVSARTDNPEFSTLVDTYLKGI